MNLLESRASEGRDMEVDERIGLAIENAVAASRWRVAARFEARETAAQFMRMADGRSSAATLLLDRAGKDATGTMTGRAPSTHAEPGEGTGRA